MIAQLLDIEFLAKTGAKRGNNRTDFVVGKNLVKSRFST
jgi:hypothetical protein